MMMNSSVSKAWGPHGNYTDQPPFSFLMKTPTTFFLIDYIFKEFFYLFKILNECSEALINMTL